jgi:hypothetical protein
MGAELPLEREIVVLSVWPTETSPKVTVLGETTRVPELPTLRLLIPQPERTSRRLDTTTIA